MPGVLPRRRVRQTLPPSSRRRQLPRSGRALSCWSRTSIASSSGSQLSVMSQWRPPSSSSAPTSTSATRAPSAALPVRTKRRLSFVSSTSAASTRSYGVHMSRRSISAEARARPDACSARTPGRPAPAARPRRPVGTRDAAAALSCAATYPRVRLSRTRRVCEPRPMRPSLYEFAGGEPAFLALATAHHARCLADPELNHPFSHDDQHPQHVERLAAYWAEVMGGPPAYSQSCGDHSGVLQMHAGNGGSMDDLGDRFLAASTQPPTTRSYPPTPTSAPPCMRTCAGRSTRSSSTRRRARSSRPARRCRAGAGTAWRSSSHRLAHRRRLDRRHGHDPRPPGEPALGRELGAGEDQHEPEDGARRQRLVEQPDAVGHREAGRDVRDERRTGRADVVMSV